MLAGAIAEAAFKAHGAELGGDGAEQALQCWRTFQQSQRTLADELRETAGGRNLVRYGFEDDLARCTKLDLLNVVPEQISRDPPIFK